VFLTPIKAEKIINPITRITPITTITGKIFFIFPPNKNN
jgi:hypothetical protein